MKAQSLILLTLAVLAVSATVLLLMRERGRERGSDSDDDSDDDSDETHIHYHGGYPLAYYGAPWNIRWHGQSRRLRPLRARRHV